MYLINKELLKPEKVENSIKIKLDNIENNFSIENKELVKNEINFLAVLCKNGNYKESLEFKLLMLILSTSINYAIEYENPDSIDKVIKILKTDPVILKHKPKEMFSLNYVYANSNYAKWILLLSNEDASYFNNLFYKGNIKLLLKAKYSLLKIYKEDLSKKLSMHEGQRYSYLYLLISVLSTLLRFSEGFQILDTLDKNNFKSPLLAGLNAQLLDSLKSNTCLNHNTKLTEKLFDNCEIFLKSEDSVPFMNNKLQKRSVLRLKEKYSKDFNVEKEKPSAKNEVKSFKSEFIKNEPFKSILKRIYIKKKKFKLGSKNAQHPNKYEQFCSNKDLFLNEHKFYCSCKQSLKDNLKIVTRHPHTKIKWVEQYEDLLKMLINNFKYARKTYFKSLDQTTESDLKSDIELGESELKREYLKTAFGDCYRILDKIGLGVLAALNINHKAILNQNQEKISNTSDEEIKATTNQSQKKVFFLNMWDIENLFDDELINMNPYLMTLYSIAKDLDNVKETSAFKDFRKVRNAIEHKLFFILDKPKNNKGDFYYITKKELSSHCLLMLGITKSAIFSFTYFIRKESISKSEDINVIEH